MHAPPSAITDAPESPGRSQIAAGLRDSLGVGIGIFPLGIALGVLVVQAGLPWWVAPALSIVVFAGSVELLMVSMLAAATPILTIAVTVFAINFRHVFYALSFPIDRVRRGLPRAYSIYALIDEAYATYVLMPAAQLSSRRVITGQFAMQAYWVLGGVAGVLIAGALPEPIEGFEFALVALFVVMTLDAVRSAREVPSAVLAGLAVGIAIVVVPDNALLAALVLFTVMLAVRYALSRRASSGSETDGGDRA
ncbi:AzlC family ABC transporter permease [Leucobacter rhizosphaerae]|uniref:AzlC family ABC transporter permease n=1 Tax=Leucobacter rhizosphaerae TaxID=2932245 RepID=A0ABY4FWI9_9MICO|nr:AzlC family ABC transporter permease [Leucobacter rhizosphaerae]UOQ60534.1 AzlC family ABC transporter permease [Leucobacter rhizosphaerae]